MLKKMNKKLIAIPLALLIIIISILLVFSLVLKKDKYKDVEEALEHVFFYLDEAKYDDIDKMDDFCKFALVYNSKYMSKTKDEKYSKIKFTKALKRILGEGATFNFKLNDELSTYDFLNVNNCVYSNKKLINLSYNSTNEEFLISKDEENNLKNNYYLQVNWDKPEEKGNIVKLSAKALLIEENNGKYFVYSNLNQESILGEYKTLKEAQEFANKNLDLSNSYEFTLEKKDKNIIWKSFKKKADELEYIID